MNIIFASLATICFSLEIASFFPAYFLAKSRDKKFNSESWRYGLFVGNDFVLVRPNPSIFPNKCTVVPKMALTGSVQVRSVFSPWSMFQYLFGFHFLAVLWIIAKISSRGAPSGEGFDLRSCFMDEYAVIEYELLNGKKNDFAVKLDLVGRRSIERIRRVGEIVNEPIQ